MTAVKNNGVYMVGKEKSDAKVIVKVDAKRLAEAVKRTSAYKKKEK